MRTQEFPSTARMWIEGIVGSVVIMGSMYGLLLLAYVMEAK